MRETSTLLIAFAVFSRLLAIILLVTGNSEIDAESGVSLLLYFPAYLFFGIIIRCGSRAVSG